MLFIEIPQEFDYGDKNIIKYKNVNDDKWYYLYIDIETLNLLVSNYGIISCVQEIGHRYVDSPLTGDEVYLEYCGAKIKLYCKNGLRKYNFNYACLEKDY